jgi:WD40 repeat protein
VNFKIFWLNVSKCCTQELILEKLHRLSAMMQADEDVDIKYSTYSSNTKNQIVHFRNHLRKVLELPKFRECLIVLIGVQDENILKAFDLPCKFLMTTKHIERFDFIPEEQKKVIEINSGFTKEESYELFAKAVKAQKLPEDMTTHVNDFHSRCDGHPFILSVIAKSFQNFNDSERENEREKRAESWISSLDKYVLHDFKEKITMSMIESMRFLKEENQERYKMMVIFTDNRDIPYKVLEKLWGLSPQQTETMILKLFKYSLIEAHVNEQNEKACSLHYIHYHFLLENVPKEKQKEYHEQLISKYEVERVLSERKNLNLEFPKDEYFHYFIPYHWEGADRKDLFKLYLDFEFLEQKIRYTRLTNTLGDLIRFADLISDGKQYLDDYLEELMFFLCNSVQQIFESSAVNLLQLALNSSGVVQAEAKNQIKRFPDRVWMRDIDHGEQTQIVQISSNSQQQIVRFVRPNNNLFCLISLRDHNILLQQIIRDYHDGAQLYQNDTSFKIIELQGFNNNTFLALTEDGKISVYSMKNVPTRRNSLPLTIFVRTSTHQENFIQRISEDITCFVVTNNNTQADLIVGSSQGKIKFYSWKNHKFEENKAMSIKSKVQNLHRLAKIELENEYLMLINRSGGISFIDLRNSSEMGATKEWKQLESPINLHQGKCSLTKRPITLCVAKNKVVQVTHKKIIGDMFIDIEYDDIYETENDHEILSSAMSNDTKYLILGTTKGIFVFDRLEMEVIMRRNISDRVLSLDINFFEDMYYLCSILEDSEQVICLHGFDDKRDDYKKIMPILVGKDLFDIKDKNGLWEMVAVDDKKTIQFRLSSDEFGKPFDQNEVFYNIEKIIYVGDDIVIGCTSGSVYKIIENGSPQQILELESAITYLELIDNVIVASCNTNFVILSVEKSATFTGAVTKAFRYADSQLLLIKKDCTLEIYNTVTFLNRHKTLAKNSVCTAETFHSSFVAIATTMKKVFFWNFDEMSEVQEISFDEKITALAVSPDKTVLAIGLSNGLIEVG